MWVVCRSLLKSSLCRLKGERVKKCDAPLECFLYTGIARGWKVDGSELIFRQRIMLVLLRASQGRRGKHQQR